MRFILFAVSLTLAAPVLAAAGGGGSFPSTEPSSNDSALEANYSQGEYLVKADKCEEAITFFEKVIAKKRRHADALNYLGYCHRKAGRKELALEYYQKALDVNDKHLGAHEYLGELYLMMNDLAKAEAQRAKLAALCPQGCTQLEDMDDAIAAYKAKNP